MHLIENGNMKMIDGDRGGGRAMNSDLIFHILFRENSIGMDSHVLREGIS